MVLALCIFADGNRETIRNNDEMTTEVIKVSGGERRISGLCAGRHDKKGERWRVLGNVDIVGGGDDSGW